MPGNSQSPVPIKMRENCGHLANFANKIYFLLTHLNIRIYYYFKLINHFEDLPSNFSDCRILYSRSWMKSVNSLDLSSKRLNSSGLRQNPEN